MGAMGNNSATIRSRLDTMVYAYDDLCGLNSDKPVMLAEWGIGEFPKAGDKAWISGTGPAKLSLPAP